MSSAESSLDRPFIVSTGANKDDPETRKLIRSRVMLGKNRRKNKQSKISALVDSDIHQLAPTRRPFSVIPRKVGSGLDFVTFPDKIDPQAAAEAIGNAVVVDRSKFILERCLIFDELSSTMIQHISTDALFIQNVIFMTQTHFDLVEGRSSSYPCQTHLKTLQIVRERISFGDKKAQLADCTVFGVTNLASHALRSGEDKSARHHMEGIRKIIDLRGGVNNISKTKILIEVLRCDIGMALHTGAKPLFFSDNHGSRLYLPYPDEILSRCKTDRILDVLDDLDDGITEAWQFMKGFCSLINLSAEAQGRIPWELFLNAMAPLMYRLLYMSFDVSSMNEAIRLGLLAISSHIFLQWKLVRVTHAYLSISYRNFLNRLISSDSIPPRLSSWLLMIGAVSVFKQPDDSWLRHLLTKNIQSSGIKSWSEMRGVLDSCLWIPLVQEKPGKDFFESAFEPNQGT